jgi:hypothetical protein
MTSYLKSCIFCGDPPTNKNKEHVIPKWLIELTGNKARPILANFDKKTLESRRYSFNAFTFPACEACNTKYSDLEAKAKNALQKIIDQHQVTTSEISIVLDWFDKVRIGLWMAQYHLDRNPGGISPNFHIATRIGVKDRLLGVARLNGMPNGINWVGAETPLFLRSPSCFGLRINSLIFLNMSFEFMLSKNLGFPYPSNYVFLPAHRRCEAEITHGQELITMPVLPFSPDFNMRWMLQPILNSELLNTEYHTEFVKGACLSTDHTKSKPLIQIGQTISPPSESYLIQTPYEPSATFEDFCITVLQAQIDLQSVAPNDSLLSSEAQSRYRATTERAVVFNSNQIQAIRKRGVNLNV